MYPPKRTDRPTEWLSGLLESMGRAGVRFDGDIGLDEGDDGLHVTVRLQEPIVRGSWPALKSFITDYSNACGWVVQGLRHTRRGLKFSASRA